MKKIIVITLLFMLFITSCSETPGMNGNSSVEISSVAEISSQTSAPDSFHDRKEIEAFFEMNLEQIKAKLGSYIVIHAGPEGTWDGYRFDSLKNLTFIFFDEWTAPYFEEPINMGEVFRIEVSGKGPVVSKEDYKDYENDGNFCLDGVKVGMTNEEIIQIWEEGEITSNFVERPFGIPLNQEYTFLTYHFDSCRYIFTTVVTISFESEEGETRRVGYGLEIYSEANYNLYKS